MFARVENRTALALPVLRIDRLDTVTPTCSDSSLRLILRRAIMTSKLTIIVMIIWLGRSLLSIG